MKTTASKKTNPRIPTALEGLIDRHGQLTARGWGGFLDGLEAALDTMADEEEETDSFRILYAVLSSATVRFYPHDFQFIDQQLGPRQT